MYEKKLWVIWNDRVLSTKRARSYLNFIIIHLYKFWNMPKLIVGLLWKNNGLPAWQHNNKLKQNDCWENDHHLLKKKSIFHSIWIKAKVLRTMLLFHFRKNNSFINGQQLLRRNHIHAKGKKRSCIHHFQYANTSSIETNPFQNFTWL